MINRYGMPFLKLQLALFILSCASCAIKSEKVGAVFRTKESMLFSYKESSQHTPRFKWGALSRAEVSYYGKPLAHITIPVGTTLTVTSVETYDPFASFEMGPGVMGTEFRLPSNMLFSCDELLPDHPPFQPGTLLFDERYFLRIK